MIDHTSATLIAQQIGEVAYRAGIILGRQRDPELSELMAKAQKMGVDLTSLVRPLVRK